LREREKVFGAKDVDQKDEKGGEGKKSTGS
jgi:hypothetical protein